MIAIEESSYLYAVVLVCTGLIDECPLMEDYIQRRAKALERAINDGLGTQGDIWEFNFTY